jgi:hypothetical protein
MRGSCEATRGDLGAAPERVMNRPRASGSGRERVVVLGLAFVSNMTIRYCGVCAENHELLCLHMILQ